MTEGEIVANVPFDFPFAGKIFSIKRASLRQVMEWQRQSVEINKSNDGTTDLKLVAAALLLALRVADPAIDENYILENAPGDIDVIATLQTLGFMSQQKVEAMTKMRDALATKPTTGDRFSGS